MRVCVIDGQGGGIGSVICEVLADAGADIAACLWADRRAEELRAPRTEAGDIVDGRRMLPHRLVHRRREQR